MAAFLLAFAKSEAAPAPSASDLFAQRVLPLFKEKCFACHGDKPDKLKAGYDMRTRDSAMRGGDSGESAVAPGHPDSSPLYLAVSRTHETDWKPMPPKENDKLSGEQIESIRHWIAGGAPWPDDAALAAASSQWDAASGGITVKTSGGLSPEWTNRRYQPDDLWAYQPIKHPKPPADLIDPSRTRNEIDRFLQTGLRRKGITQLAPVADKRILIRRATFDLTGLPPTPAEAQAFLADQSPDAYDRLITRLLASPAYGEQQARYWLDVVRYADSGGFSNDFERPNAWRYRDYVIRSFNADKPYNRFVTEQVAGDEVWPENPEMLIATGYLRMGPWEHTAMTVAAVTRQDFLDDVTHHIGVSLLGQGMRCCRCHDHKFDPLPTRDYYRLQAVFATTQFAERPVAFLPEENVAAFDAARLVVKKRLAQVHAAQDELKRKGEDALTALLQARGVKSIEELPEADRPKKDYLGPLLGLTKTDLTMRKIFEKSRAYLEREMQRFDPYAFSVYSGPANQYVSTKALNLMPAKPKGEYLPVHILLGGSLEAPGDAVVPGVLSAVAGSLDAVLPSAPQGRRAALARWIVSPENTLTARVIVNRIWQQHFGRGLVGTPNNFGKMGAKPSNPELLDWLASWLIDHGWSLKELHRLILSSAAYQEAGDHPDMERLNEIDSKDALLAYYPPRRLAAEELRDAMLAVTEELNPEAGGPGIFPQINWEVAFQPRHIMGSVAPAYLPSPTPQQRDRRTIYAYRCRTLADPMLEVFNRPGSEISCERRDETTVTPQAFALFNSEFANARALAFAASLENAAPAFGAQIEMAFQRVYARSPTAAEAEACRGHFDRMLIAHQRETVAPEKLPASIRRHMVEELTGETVYWDEDLSALSTYQPDLQAADVKPETRALADVCLALLNSNEFLYIR